MATFQEKLSSQDFLRVVCVGDAQTTQAISQPAWSDWLQRALWEHDDLQKSWRRQVINTSIERSTPQHVATYLSHYVSDFKPDMVILSFGVTPLFPAYEESVFIPELDGLLKILTDLGTELVLWSPYALMGGMGKDATLDLYTLYEQKARAIGARFVDIYHEFENYEQTKLFTYSVLEDDAFWGLKSGGLDFVHCNEIGNYIIAKKIAEDGLGITLPTLTKGSYVIPALEGLRKWGV